MWTMFEIMSFHEVCTIVSVTVMCDRIKLIRMKDKHTESKIFLHFKAASAW